MMPTLEELQQALSGLEVTVRLSAEAEFDKDIFPAIEKRLSSTIAPMASELKSLMRHMYSSGAASVALGAIAGFIPGARSAVMAERERCAQIAERCADNGADSGAVIADTIRSGCA